MVDDIKTTVTDGNDQTTTLPDYIIFTVTYSDGTAIETNHLLSKRVDENTPTREKYKVRVEFDSETETLPSTNATYKITYAVTYKQADSNASNRNPFADAGKGVYFDPVSSAQCDNTTYNQTAVKNGTSTCYKWNIIKYEGSNVVMQLDHNLTYSQWANPETYNTIQPTANTTSSPKVSKLGDINTKAKVQKIKDIYNGDYCSTCHNEYGPYTAMQALTTATSTWTRVPLIANFSHTPKIKVATSNVVISGDFTTLTIQNGVYQAGNNQKTRIENVRARMITVDDIEEILEAKGHTLSEFQGVDTTTTYWDGDVKHWLNSSEFYLKDLDEVSWLYADNELNDHKAEGSNNAYRWNTYYTMTQGYGIGAAWIVAGDGNYICKDGDTSNDRGLAAWREANRDEGIRPVITVPKSSIVIVN